MPVLSSYDYAMVRLVPSNERGECINVGVLLFCRTRRFLAMHTHLDVPRLALFAPSLDLNEVTQQLEHLKHVCAGGKDAGPIGELSQSERFHWLVSPRSTIIQTSVVHSGLCNNPAATLQHLLETLVQS
jgi:hypothetical protein